MEKRPSEMSPETWAQLAGRLWHATTLEAWRAILADGAIHVGAGPGGYANGFCRLSGAVSLFDMSAPAGDIDAAARNWLPWLSGEAPRVRLWIEINRAGLGDRFIDPVELRRRWKETDLRPRPKIIAGVEGAHVGALPIATVLGVTLFDGRSRFRRCVGVKSTEGEAEAFAAEAPARPPLQASLDPVARAKLAERLRLARERVARQIR
jgi:hypothetical protein